MRSKLSMLCVAALATSAFAGCGSSSSSSSSTTTTSSAAAPATSTPTGTGSSGGGSLANNPQAQAAVAQCKASLNSVPTLNAATKDKLSKLCDSITSGDPNAIKKAEAQVCQEVAKSLPAQAQQTALASCPKS